MGRKATPPKLRVLTGNPGKRKIPVGPDMTTDMPVPPSWVTGYALEEWNRMSPGLHAIGSLSYYNAQHFAAYCQAVAELRMCVEIQNSRISQGGIIAGILEKTTNGNVIQNAIFGSISSALKNLQKLSSDFGLPPCKHGIPEKPKVSKFEGLIDGGKK